MSEKPTILADMMMKLPPFLAVRSQDNVILSIISACCILVMMAACLMILLGGIYISLTDLTGVSVFIIFIGLVLNIIWVNLWVKSKRTRYTDVSIDEKGITYYNRYSRQTVRIVKWEDFIAFEDPFASGIKGMSPSKGSPYLLWREMEKDGKIEIRQEIFRMKHFYPSFFKNRGELIAALLLGFAHFRRDLSIDESAFSLFYIDKEHYAFKQSVKVKDYVFAILLSIVIGLLVIFFLIRK